MRHSVVIFLVSLMASAAGPALATESDAANTSVYEQICESARLRSMERADCHAQMKTAKSDEQRRAIFQVFDVRVNGSLASNPPVQDERTGQNAAQ